MRALFLACRWQPSGCVLSCGRRERALSWGLCYKDTNPIHRGPALTPSQLPKIRVSAYELEGGHKHSAHNSGRFLSLTPPFFLFKCFCKVLSSCLIVVVLVCSKVPQSRCLRTTKVCCLTALSGQKSNPCLSPSFWWPQVSSGW